MDEDQNFEFQKTLFQETKITENSGSKSQDQNFKRDQTF